MTCLEFGRLSRWKISLCLFITIFQSASLSLSWGLAEKMIFGWFCLYCWRSYSAFDFCRARASCPFVSCCRFVLLLTHIHAQARLHPSWTPEIYFTYATPLSRSLSTPSFSSTFSAMHPDASIFWLLWLCYSYLSALDAFIFFLSPPLQQ